jgi:hypothetical protein
VVFTTLWACAAAKAYRLATALLDLEREGQVQRGGVAVGPRDPLVG